MFHGVLDRPKKDQAAHTCAICSQLHYPVQMHYLFNSCTHPAFSCSVVASSILCHSPLQLREPQEAAHQHGSMHCNTACSHDGDEGFAQWLGAANRRHTLYVERDSLLQLHQFLFKLPWYTCALNQQLLIYIYTLLLL